MREIGTFNRDSAEKFADEIGTSLRSVVAKISRMDGVTYVKPTTEAAIPARKKTEVVASVESLLDTDSGNLWGLERSTVQSLENLEQRIAQVLEDWEDQYMADVETALSGEVPEYYSLCADTGNDANESENDEFESDEVASAEVS